MSKNKQAYFNWIWHLIQVSLVGQMPDQYDRGMVGYNVRNIFFKENIWIL